MKSRRLPIIVTPEARQWLRQGEENAAARLAPKSEVYASRLTVDITPELHLRIKLAALKSHQTIAGRVRQVLEVAFDDQEEASRGTEPDAR